MNGLEDTANGRGGGGSSSEGNSNCFLHRLSKLYLLGR